MMLEGSNQSTALGWVREDLDKHIDRIRQQVELVAAEAQGTNALVSARDNLRQLKFTFDALMLNGASGVLEEMAMDGAQMREVEIARRNSLDSPRGHELTFDIVELRGIPQIELVLENNVVRRIAVNRIAHSAAEADRKAEARARM